MAIVTHNFLEDMALVMCVAALATVICQLLRQPLVVGYLIAGMVVGPHVPGVYANTERVQLVADLGVTLLIFSIGLEFRLRRLMRLAPTAGLVALIQIASMISLGYLVGRLMGWTPWESLLTGAVVSISGAVIVAKAFEEVQVDSRVRELVFGVVLCEDVVAIIMLAVLITIAKGGVVSLHSFSITAGLLGAFIIVMIAIGLNRIKDDPVPDTQGRAAQAAGNAFDYQPGDVLCLRDDRRTGGLLGRAGRVPGRLAGGRIGTGSGGRRVDQAGEANLRRDVFRVGRDAHRPATAGKALACAVDA